MYLQPTQKHLVYIKSSKNRVSQMGSTGGGGQLGKIGQKLHEIDKISIFGSKQWGGDMGGHKPIFWVVEGIPLVPLTRGNPDKNYS